MCRVIGLSGAVLNLSKSRFKRKKALRITPNLKKRPVLLFIVL